MNGSSWKNWAAGWIQRWGQELSPQGIGLAFGGGDKLQSLALKGLVSVCKLSCGRAGWGAGCRAVPCQGALAQTIWAGRSFGVWGWL